MLTPNVEKMPTDRSHVPPLGPRTLGEGLRMLRHRARLSRDQLAQAAGASAGAISNYENDVSNPPSAMLRRLCGVLAAHLQMSATELWEQLGVILDRADEEPISLDPRNSAAG